MEHLSPRDMREADLIQPWRTFMNFVATGHRTGSIVQRQHGLGSATDAALSGLADDLRDRLLDGQQELALVNETFSLVREACRRRLGIEHRENQLEAAWQLLNGVVVELPTGEGKTLAALPALALRAFSGRGVWLATANDYLARRDAMAMQGVFELLGLSTGYLQTYHTHEERRRAYECDITYGTIQEFGFDFLRDQLSIRQSHSSISPTKLLQRERYSIVIDEADSILLDDARTPLIISEAQPKSLDESVFQWSITTGRTLREDLDFLPDPVSTNVWLTDEGRARIRNNAIPGILNRNTLPEIYASVAKAIEAERAFHLNRDYVVRDGKLVIVDRLNGRFAEGRQWQNGFQQLLETVNELKITPDTNPVAKVTVQTFLKGFKHLSGMTGTAREAASEFRELYGLRMVAIPSMWPSCRSELPPYFADTRHEKWDAVISSVRQLAEKRRPVLIGTRDLNASEELSSHLSSARITHQLLTARQEADEAERISRAGQEGIVTVSTSIAGRGTDIRLGPGIAELGGLHVIAADLFDAARIDRQLAGRGGRQGDPVSYQKILSLEDGLLQAAWSPDYYQWLVKCAMSRGASHKLAMMRRAQRCLEHQHRLARRDLLQRDRERMQRLEELGFNPYADCLE